MWIVGASVRKSKDGKTDRLLNKTLGLSTKRMQRQKEKQTLRQTIRHRHKQNVE